MDNIICKVNLKGTEYQVAATYDASNNNIEDTYLKKSEISQESTDEGITLNSVALKEDQEQKTALVTIPNATEEKNGIMSAEDKKKLNNIISSAELFYVCTELPELDDATPGKIYCIKKTDSDTGFKEDEKNIFSEYIVLIEKSDSGETRRWEKIGAFDATPDLSGYAKLKNDVRFRSVTCTAGGFMEALHINGLAYIEYLQGVRGMVGPTYFPSGSKENMVYSENGGKVDVGTPEDFVFTLTDGTKVTKSIRVVSTINS